MAFEPACWSACTAALLLLVSACSGEAPAPAAPTQPPPTVIAPLITSAPEPIAEPTGTAAAAPVPTATSEPVADPTAAPTRKRPTLLDMSGRVSAVGIDPTPPARKGTLPAYARWRPAIENYTPSVKVGNTAALDTAARAFATYLVTMHNRIHPMFAEQFLAAVDSLPKGHPLNQDLSTHLEIVVQKDTGKIVRMGVVKTSGVTAFDLAALSAVDRAAPFGKAPDAIASPDGNVYFHWEFHRDPFDACTTRNARPYILKSVP